jgi:DNA-3-methyladenine glycosylase II
MSDLEIVQELSSIWGIGKWTAEMFLMFELGRLDVWPAGDYGVRKGWQIANGDFEMIAEKPFQSLGDSVRPYRSIAAWYCWRQIEFIKAD